MHWKLSPVACASLFRKRECSGTLPHMQKTILLAAALLLSAPVQAEHATPVPSPGEIAAAAPQADWTAIAASDLLVMDLTPDAKGRPRRVVIQLLPAPFSQGWIGNLRKLAAARWWDGLSINRVQDNYVVQWGDADGEDKAKARALPAGLEVMPESGYTLRNGSSAYDMVFDPILRRAMERAQLERAIELSRGTTLIRGETRSLEIKVPQDARHAIILDKYSGQGLFDKGWPMARSPNEIWPVHCYGMVGVGRDLSPNTGSGAELYTVIGHAPRHLDRNIALVGRVIEGIEHLSSLPRGTGALGFYETPEERTGVISIRLGSAVVDLPAYEYLSTESASFAAYADARANRRDPFFIRPAGGADICNIPVPVRRVK